MNDLEWLAIQQQMPFGMTIRDGHYRWENLLEYQYFSPSPPANDNDEEPDERA